MYIRRNIDGAFRALPSLMPIKSPSPDRKESNIISPTISPQTDQIKKSVTPSKNIQQYENSTSYKTGQIYQDSHAKGFFSHHSGTKTQQKDEIIDELKKVIRILTKNQNINYEQQLPRIDQLKKQLKVLTIQNQKLLSVIQKQKKHQQGKDLPVLQYKRQIQDLHQTLKKRNEVHNKQIDDLMQAHKSLANHCKNVEAQNRNYEKQNAKLIKLLKQKDQSQRKLYQQTKEKDFERSGFGQKLILSKIKDQYNENFRMFKENVYYQVDTMFQKVNAKVNKLQNRLELMETKVNILLKHKPDISRISQNSQNSSASARKYQKNVQPQIFIDEGSSNGESSKHSPSDLSHIIEQSRKQQSRVNQLEQQLNKAKKQLEQIRFKYQKICLDTNTTAFSHMKIDDFQNSKEIQIEQNSRQVADVLKLSNQKSIEYKTQQLKDLQDSYNRKLEQTKYFKDKQLEQLKLQTQQTIKKLVDSYNKELQLVRVQNLKKTEYLTQFSEKTSIKEKEFQLEIETLKKQIQHLQQELRQQKNNLEQTTIQQQFIINQLTQQTVKLKNQNHSLLQKISQIQHQNQQMHHNISIVNDNLQDLANDLEQKKKDISQIQQQHKQMQQQWLKQKQDIKVNHANELQTINLKHQQQNQSKEAAINLIKEQMEDLAKEKSELKRQLEQLIREKSQLKTKIKNIRRDYLITELKQLKEMIDVQNIGSNQENIRQLDNLYENISKMNTVKIQQVEQLMKDKLNLQINLLQSRQKQAKYVEMIQLLEKKIILYEAQLKEKDSTCQKLIQQKAKIEREKLGKLQAMIQMTKDQISKYQIQQSDIKAKIAQILAKQQENTLNLFIDN